MPRVVLWLALFVIALLPGTRLVAVPKAPTAPVFEVPRDRSLSLTVATTADDKPLPGARIRAFFTTDEGAALTAEGTTDAEGRTTLRLPRGAFWIIADAAGRARASVNLALDEADTTKSIAMALSQEHVLDVRVRDSEGAAIARAEIEVSGASPLPVGALTDDKGEAHVGHLGSAPFVVLARAAGYEEVSRTNVPEGQLLEISLRKLGALRVSVIDAAGAPAPRARVEIAGVSLGASRAADTDESGIVRIAGLPQGAYALRAVKSGFVSPTELDVRVMPGEERDVSLKLEPGVTIAVRVISEEPRGDVGVANANVVLAENGLTPFPLTAVSDREGRARLGPIARGPATVSVSARGYVSRGGIRVDEKRDDKAEVRVVLARAGTIEGRVVDARGFPIGGATLVVIGTDRTGAPIDEDPRRSRFRDSLFTASLAGPAALIPRGELGVVPGPVPAIPRAAPTWIPNVATAPALPTDPSAEPWTTREDGTFRLSPVSPGRVRVLARHPQYVEATSDAVELEPGGRAEVSLVLGEGGVLEGLVVDARGRPEVGARITALATRGLLERTTRTGDDGRFAFASLPDAVTLLVEADGGRAARVPVDVQSGQRRELKITLPEPREALDVRVRDDREYPIDGVELQVGSLDPAAPLRSTAFTDARGEARVAGVRGLPIRIVALHPRHASKTISLDAAGAKLLVTMTRGESAYGEIAGRRAGSLAGAEIVATAEGVRVRTTSNARGEFRLDGLPPERVRLVMRARGFAPLERTVTIESRRADRGTDLGRFELPEESAVEGEVVDDNGKPIAGARVGAGRVPTWIPAGPLPPGLALTDARGAFRLGELAEGTVSLEAYAADIGRGHADNVAVSPGRPTRGVRIVLAKGGAKASEPTSTGNVAITLGVADDGAIVITDVVEGSTAERAGIAEGDRIESVDGIGVRSMEDTRAKLAGPVQDDVIVAVRREGKSVTLRIPRESSRR